MMRLSSFRIAMFTALSAAFISNCHSQRSIDYSTLEVEGISCPARDKCRGYRSNLTYMDRSCECDYNCTAYKDCCIDALPNGVNSRPPARTDVTCLPYGDHEHGGVYAINTCSDNWNEQQVREKCIGSYDFSDPLSSAPVTDVAQKKTYRNMACATCNNANSTSLKTFGMRLNCYGISEEETLEQIMEDLFYNQERKLWGVNRLNRFGNETTFYGCAIIYDVQEYLNSSVRFCRTNIISTCAKNWTRSTVANKCAQYMAVVYSLTRAYKNPHCAICNHLTVESLSCENDSIGRKPPRPFTFGHLLDVNPDGGDEVGRKKITTPECPENHTYDPFFKRCKPLMTLQDILG